MEWAAFYEHRLQARGAARGARAARCFARSLACACARAAAAEVNLLARPSPLEQIPTNPPNNPPNPPKSTPKPHENRFMSREQEGQKAIFHLEAFVAKFMSLYKSWALSMF